MVNPLNTITATQVKVIVTYVLVTFLPNVDGDLRAGIIGAVTALYILATAILKVARLRSNARPDNDSVNPTTAPPPGQEFRTSAPVNPQPVPASEAARPALMDSLRGGR